MAASAARHTYQKPEQPSQPEISMARHILVSLSLCFFVLFNGYLAQGRVQQRQFGECQLDSLDAVEPTNRIETEAGVIETWDHNNQQFRCAGVAVIRRTIEPNGLLLPQYSNAPELLYVVRGKGVIGVLFPGCPETFEEPQREFQQGPGQGEGRRFQRDRHQKIRQFREGDILALPAGVAHWCYNDGDSPVVTVSLLHTNNFANQLDENPRHFYLAGDPVNEHRQQGELQFEHGRRGQSREFQRHREPSQRGEQKGSGNNLFSGLDAEFLADTFNVDVETARRLQCNGDERRNIVRVEGRLQVVRPPWSHEEREREEGREGREREWEQRRYGGSGRCDNGFEETVCSMRLRENIGDRSRADIYTEQAGRINTVNSNNLPILRWLRLSAERGDLYRDAICAPQWNMNAHSVLYAIRGRARVQVVDDYGQTVFDGELRQGQVLPVPQFYAVAKRASSEGFEWVAFKTNDNAMTNPLAGRTSALRALPDEVLANAYRISREEARRLKYNRQEATLFSSNRSSSPGRAAE